MVIEQETFWTLLHNRAHWEFEIFVTVVFDVVIGGMAWPFVQRHWNHHMMRDRREGLLKPGTNVEKDDIR